MVPDSFKNYCPACYGAFEVTANNRTQAHSLVANYGMETLSINMAG